MSKPNSCLCESKGADQRNCTADQCLCFRYTDTLQTRYNALVGVHKSRNANLLSWTRLIAVSVVYWWVGNLYDVCIGLTELGGLLQSPCKME